MSARERCKTNTSSRPDDGFAQRNDRRWIVHPHNVAVFHAQPAIRESSASADNEFVAHEHYSTVSKAYHSAFFYTGEYESWQLDHILLRLKLRPDHKLVDIGGGTGRFALLLRDTARLDQSVLCVDPSESMIKEAAQLRGIDTVCAGALEFVRNHRICYDRALVKEVVHHLADVDLLSMYRGILAQLTPGGVVLTCTRPHVVDYPLFEAALKVWSHQQPSMQQYEEIIRAAGFDDVQCEVVEYPATLDKEWWLQMVRNRFWSTLALEHFSEDELAEGVEEISAKFRHTTTIAFTERMVFITASKSETAVLPIDQCMCCFENSARQEAIYILRYCRQRVLARRYRR